MAVVQRDRAGKNSKQNRKENKDRNVNREEEIKDDLSKNFTLTSSWAGT
jgi:hypothetical protein